MYKLLAILLLTSSGLTVALAKAPPPPVLKPPPAPVRPHATAPEMDPSSAISAIALLLGGVMVLRGRSVAKK
jgi:hypothetical protein